MRWVHVQTSQYVCVFEPSNPLNGYYLCIDPSTNNPNQVVCTTIDVERIIKLPKLVAFKGDKGYYMQLQSGVLQAFTGKDRARKEAWYEVYPLSNGDVRIKCVRNDKFWRRGLDGSIVADSNDTTSADPNTVFQVAQLSDNSIALINRGSNLFCQRMDTDNRLLADVDSGVKEAGLEVEEPVVSRHVEVDYRLRDARIYDVRPRSWLSQIAINDSEVSENGNLQTTLSITYTQSLSCSFHVTKSVSTNISSTTTVSASIPFVADLSTELQFSTGVTAETGFGQTVDKSEELSFTATIIVPPGKKRQARMMASEAKYDVPFSYVLTEVQADNKLTRTHLQDGVYRGMNGYEFKVELFDPEVPETNIFVEPVPTRMFNFPTTFQGKRSI